MISRRQFLAASGALVLAGPSLAACAPDRGDVKRLAFLNWQDYVDPDLLARFTEATGIEVTYDTYESNDELARRLGQAARTRRGGREGSTFDLIVPSDNFVPRFRDADLLGELDHELLPNLVNLAPELQEGGIDPDNRFTVPWATGTTGIGYLTSAFDEPPTYETFLDPALAGRVSVLDETRDAFALALFSLGEDPNTTDDAVIEAATERLREIADVAEFDSSDYLDRLAAGELVAVQGYSSDVLQARTENDDVAFVLPEAGALRWVDLLAIPEGAARAENAHRFIDHYLDPEVSAANSEAVLVDTGNAAARERLAPELLDDPAIFPPADVLDRLTFTEDLGEDVEDRYAERFESVKS